MKKLLFVVLIFIAASSGSQAQTSPPTNSPAEDAAAIRQTALDYIEGWYEGNAERMERALHPELAKRMVETNRQTGRSRLNQIGAMTLVQQTRAGGGKNTPKDKQQKDVTILDVFENAASVKIVASGWVDYMHMERFNGHWVIINVLWELKPDKK
jgi:hypothetical protein